MKRLMAMFLLATMLSSTATSCETEADSVKYEMSNEAENLKLKRKCTVINTRTDKVEYELVGYFSREDTSSEQIVLIEKVTDNTYKRHIISLNEDTIYVIEDLDYTEIN